MNMAIRRTCPATSPSVIWGTDHLVAPRSALQDSLAGPSPLDPRTQERQCQADHDGHRHEVEQAPAGKRHEDCCRNQDRRRPPPGDRFVIVRQGPPEGRQDDPDASHGCDKIVFEGIPRKQEHRRGGQQTCDRRHPDNQPSGFSLRSIHRGIMGATGESGQVPRSRQFRGLRKAKRSVHFREWRALVRWSGMGIPARVR